MSDIAPEAFVETQVFAHFAPRLFNHGKAVCVDGRTFQVAIRSGNVKIKATDQNEYNADGFLYVDGHAVGVIDPERKTEWCGGAWPVHWHVNIAVHPRKQFDCGQFYANSRTNKLLYMRQCAMEGMPGFIALYSNAFGDPDKPLAAARYESTKSILLVPATALYARDGSERLPIQSQPNRFGKDLPVFRPSINECILITSPEQMEHQILSSVTDFLRSLKHEG